MNNKKTRVIVTVIIAIAISLVSFFGGFAVSRLARKKEVSSFEWALKTIRDNYYEDIPEEKLLYCALNGMTASGLAGACLDKYSAYYTAEQYRELVATHGGSMSGVGISFTYVPSDEKYPQAASGVIIESVVGNSPAFYSGLEAGEYVTGAKDREGAFGSQKEFIDYIDGKKTGEKFTLITDRGEYEMAKSNYTASYCTMSTKTADWNINYDGGGMNVVKTSENAGIDCLPDGAAYLRLDQFYGNAAYEMAELIGEFNAENCTSLILDLRGNGGGYVDVMCDMSGIYTGQLQNPHKTAMQAVYRNGKKEVYYVNNLFPQNKRLPAGTKVSVLADNGTASASEALLGVLIDNGVIDYGDVYISEFSDRYLDFTGTRAKNGRTYGKGIMQTTFVRPFTGEALKLTTAKIYWPKGVTSIHDVGLSAADGENKCNAVYTDWDVTYGDLQLAEAVKMIYAD